MNYKNWNYKTNIIAEPREVWNSIPECRGQKNCIDPWGRKINLFEYGKKNEYGWNIDHVIPQSANGGNDIKNLQPLHWKSNKEKGDKTYCEKWGRC